jgi:hypothetical protein
MRFSKRQPFRANDGKWFPQLTPSGRYGLRMYQDDWWFGVDCLTGVVGPLQFIEAQGTADIHDSFAYGLVLPRMASYGLVWPRMASYGLVWPWSDRGIKRRFRLSHNTHRGWDRNGQGRETWF